MDLRSEYPYSLLRKGIIRSYPSLKKDIRTDITVIGAGITGSLVAYHLAKAGIDVTVIDRRHVGMGSTAASTGLLQYEIDIPLHKLSNMIGKEKAIKSYQLCRQALYDIETICSELKQPTDFSKRPSFQYASNRYSVKNLEIEYKIRKYAGFSIDWMQSSDIIRHFGFEKPAGILSKDGGQVDAYSLTHSLLSAFKIPVYDHTEIKKASSDKQLVNLITADGKKITTRKVIIACGYESGKYLPFKVEKFNSTYSIVSEQMAFEEAWYKNSLIWETALPYLYMRTSADKRILVGGKDDRFSNPKKRDEAINRKALVLEKAFCKLFPHLSFKTDFKWAGVFASTKDGLPYIGSIRQRPNFYFALGYGGNGITFSLLAAQIIRDDLLGKKNKAGALFQFDR